MKLHEAIATGKRVKRSHHTMFFASSERVYGVSDVTSDDWEAEGEEQAGPCPFCGAEGPRFISLRTEANDTDAGWFYCVCKAIGPQGETRAEAVSAWNRRVK